MSLTEPTVSEKVIAAWKGWPVVARVGVPLVLGLVILGALLFGLDRTNRYFHNRKAEKLKANVNLALQAVNNQAGTVANDKVEEAVAIEKVKEAANAVITSSNATDDAKAQANAAVANYLAAKNAHVPTGTTEADLDAKLRALGE